MPTYKIAPKTVAELANDVLCQWPTHKPLLDAKVKIDYVFAYADVDANGLPKNCAIMLGGYPCNGVARIVKLKDRVLGHGDAEITLDANWWDGLIGKTGEELKRGLLDHELHHLEVKTDKFGRIDFDDIHRPLLRMRKHDYQFGWFNVVAERNGVHSQEQIQAQQMMSKAGQFYWPEIVKASAH
jgi:hypothetical protein